MTKAKGRPQKSRLADMAIVPVDPRYYPPPDDECEEHSEPIVLADGHKIVIRRQYPIGRSTVVRFGVNQSIRLARRDWQWVSRIDSDHGEIHRHDYTAAGGHERTVLQVIPATRGEELVDWWCEHAAELMHNEWEDNVRRWRGDDQ